MVFSSTLFLFVFLPVLLVVYHGADPKYKNGVLLTASLLFYAWGEPRHILLLILSVAVNYIMGLLLEKKKRRSVLAIAVGYNLAMLFFFKYLNFAGHILETVLGIRLNIPTIALPIGISFYTFQIMSYVIDVYRGTVPAQHSIADLALYISLFPQLIAGPIVRYSDVEKQIRERTTDWNMILEGTRRFAAGFSKKILLADQLAKLADIAFENGSPSIWLNWLGILAYTLQIYFDFSGYSDMAIGLGRMFGFRFLENFNYPYIAESIQDFWRRWHISLSSWFRDYLYIPLGGSRKGNLRTYINQIIVFFLTGLWHGASFNFIVWGLFYAVFLIAERLGGKNILGRCPKALRHVYALLIIMTGWVFFRAPGLKAALHYLLGMVTFSGKDIPNMIFVMNPLYWTCLAAGCFFAVPHVKIKKALEKNNSRETILDAIVFFFFVLAVCYMVGSGYSPFLYFRF